MPTRVGRRRGGAAGGGEGDAATVERLKGEVKAGPQEAYEALQTARALFARWESQGQGGRARALAVALAGAFAEAGEHKAALDLARLYMAGNTTRKPPSASSDASESGGGARVTELTPAEARRARLKAKAEAAASSKQQVEAEAEQAADPAMAPHRFGGGGREQMLALVAALPQGAGERLALLKGVARWSAEETGQAVPDMELLLLLAGAYREAGEYGQAAQRLAQAASLPSTTDLRPAADAYASLLAEWAEGGYRGEADLFVARAVLHILARVSSPAGMDAAGAYARAVLEAAAAKADGGMGMAGVEGSPLVHFVWVLVELVQHRKPGAPEAFQLLADRYRPSIERDPDGIGRAVGRIAEVYFGILPPPNPMQALLQSMMGGMGGGGGGLLGSMLGGGAGGGGGLLGALGGMGSSGL